MRRPRAGTISSCARPTRRSGSATCAKGKPREARTSSFGLDARIDTGRWLEVSGTVQQGRGLQWIEAARPAASRIAKAPVDTTGRGADVSRAAGAGAGGGVQHADGGRNRRRAHDEPSGFSSRGTSIRRRSRATSASRTSTPDRRIARRRLRRSPFTTQYIRRATGSLEVKFAEAPRALPHGQGRAARRHRSAPTSSPQALDAHVRARRTQMRLRRTSFAARRRRRSYPVHRLPAGVSPR